MRTPRGERGQVLPLAVILTLIMGVFALGLLWLFQHEVSWMMHTKRSTDSLHVAQAALDKVIYKLQQGSNWDQLNAPALSCYVASIPWTDVQGGTYWVLTITAGNQIKPPGDPLGDRTIKFKAWSSAPGGDPYLHRQRIIMAVVRRGVYPFSGAEAGAAGISVSNQVDTDSYNSELGNYRQVGTTHKNFNWDSGLYENWGYMGNLYSQNGGITIANNSTIMGGVQVNGSFTTSNSCIVYGNVYANTDISITGPARVYRPNNNTQDFFYELVSGSKVQCKGEAHPGVGRTCTCAATNVPSGLISSTSSLRFTVPPLPVYAEPPTSGHPNLAISGTTVTLALSSVPTYRTNITISKSGAKAGALILTGTGELWCNSIKMTSGNVKLIANGQVKVYVNTFVGPIADTEIVVDESDPDNYLHLLLGTNGTFASTQTGVVNNNSHDWSKSFALFSKNTNTKAATITLGNSGCFKGVVYAPGTIVGVTNNTEIFGAIVAWQVQNSNIFRIHFDESLINTKLPVTTSVQSPVTIMAWEELTPAKRESNLPSQ